MTDLKTEKWDEIEAKVKFEPGIMKSKYSFPVFLSTGSEYHLGKVAAKKCIKCEELFPLGLCPNCSSDQFVPGITTQNIAGLFCYKCDKGFSSWECPNCKTENPISKSLVVKKSGCFIATATCDSSDHVYVRDLSAFRDKVLMNSQLGKYFVDFYYLISPPMALIIRHSSFLRWCSRLLVVMPMATLARRYLSKNSINMRRQR